jgi:hypothetical protein
MGMLGTLWGMVKSAGSIARPVVEARAKRPAFKLDVGLPSGDATHRFVHAHLYYPRKLFGVQARCTGAVLVTPAGEERGFAMPIRFTKNREPAARASRTQDCRHGGDAIVRLRISLPRDHAVLANDPDDLAVSRNEDRGEDDLLNAEEL